MSANLVLAALKRETTFGTPAGATSGRRLRFIDSPGLEYSRAPVESMERRSDLLQNIGRLGSKAVSGSFNSEVNPGGDFDWLIEDAVRGTLGALSPAAVTAISPHPGTQVALVATPAVPVHRSYSIEQYESYHDETELFLGCRLVQTRLAMQPDETARAEFMFEGVDRQLLATGASPYYTTPSLTSGIPLIATDASITYDGATVTTLTGLDLTLAVTAGRRPTIGNLVSPDIYMNRLTVSAEISAIRANFAELTRLDAETTFEVKVVMMAPGSHPKLVFGVILPRCKLMNVSAPFSGGDDAKIETRRIWVHPPVGASDAVRFYTSTETPVATTS